MTHLLTVDGLTKRFTLHLQGGVVLPVLDAFSFDVAPGECVVLHGPSGIGKSTILKLVYGSYKALGGRIVVQHDGGPVDLVTCGPRAVLEVRRRTMGYVSQFLRAVPRVPALDVVADPLLALGVEREEARERAAVLLRRLDLPERLWGVPPATFSGGEQQRVNIARGLIHPFPLLLLDEPTASLDAGNRERVIELVVEARQRGAALLAILHDAEARERIATRLVELARPRIAA